jgi:hypothetical protein
VWVSPVLKLHDKIGKKKIGCNTYKTARRITGGEELGRCEANTGNAEGTSHVIWSITTSILKRD